jgi:hypothetical protein
VRRGWTVWTAAGARRNLWMCDCVFVAKRAVDLLDDPAWKHEVGTVHPPRPSNASLVCTLILVFLFMASMALPWFHSEETPPWTPFSHWLDLGWSPGTQRWGFLLFALAVALAVVIGFTIRERHKVLFGLLPLLAAALVVTTILEASAHLSPDPGPPLRADFGAWTGEGFAFCILVAAAVAAIFGTPKGCRQAR